MLAAGTIIIPFLLSRWPKFGNQDISTFERKWKGMTEQKEKESGSRFLFWWKWNVFNGEQEGGREGAGWTFTIPHPRGGGIENHMPQSAGCKLLRRLCAMTWDFISEKSGDRTAGTYRIPQSIRSICYPWCVVILCMHALTYGKCTFCICSCDIKFLFKINENKNLKVSFNIKYIIIKVMHKWKRKQMTESWETFFFFSPKSLTCPQTMSRQKQYGATRGRPSKVNPQVLAPVLKINLMSWHFLTTPSIALHPQCLQAIIIFI